MPRRALPDENFLEIDACLPETHMLLPSSEHRPEIKRKPPQDRMDCQVHVRLITTVCTDEGAERAFPRLLRAGGFASCPFSRAGEPERAVDVPVSLSFVCQKDTLTSPGAWLSSRRLLSLGRAVSP